MNQDSNLLWLSVSPHLKCFDKRLLAQLAKVWPVRHWAYSQSIDEPCCTEVAVAALHEYISDRAALEQRAGNQEYKVHLLGHGVSGAIALLYARQHPERVASLTLLSVNARPSLNWQAYYYALRARLPCSREAILTRISQSLLGNQPVRLRKALSELLRKDLDSNLTLHSLVHHSAISSGSTEVPLLVCNGARDPVVFNGGQTHSQESWHNEMKVGDRLWQCPEGNHFFHFRHAKETADVITEYISNLSCLASIQLKSC